MQNIDAKQVETVGFNLGNCWFHVHGVDGQGKTCVNRRLPRSRVEAFFAALPQCRVAMETCGGAHHWGCLLTSLGHEVKLIPAQFVRPYVKSNKNDAADAEAICEAAQRPGMRFAALKDLDMQAMQALHRPRRLLIKQRKRRVEHWREVPMPPELARDLEMVHYLREASPRRVREPLWRFSRATAHRKVVAVSGGCLGRGCCLRAGIRRSQLGRESPTAPATLGRRRQAWGGVTRTTPGHRIQ